MRYKYIFRFIDKEAEKEKSNWFHKDEVKDLIERLVLIGKLAIVEKGEDVSNS